jgi:hypothetical protein
MTDHTCTWYLEGHPPCGKPANVVEVLVVAGSHAGTVGTVNWCDEHGKMFYAQQENEYLKGSGYAND